MNNIPLSYDLKFSKHTENQCSRSLQPPSDQSIIIALKYSCEWRKKKRL